MKHPKRILVGSLVAIGLSLFLAACSGAVPQEEVDRVEHPKLDVYTKNGTVEIGVEIADTFEERRKGLMFRTSLDDKKGMFFVFDEPKQLDFWMKNTLIPLDMIFIDSKYKIVHVAKNAEPCKADPCPIYSSIRPAQYVLEIKGGESDQLGIAPGDSVALSI